MYFDAIYLQEFFFFSVVIYGFSLWTLPTVLTGNDLWKVYTIWFLFFLGIIPFFIYKYKYINKIPLLILPFVVFFVLQIIPLPRSQLIFEDPQDMVGMPANYEPWAVGIGYPYSIFKLFLNEGCLNGWLESGNCLEADETNNPYIKLIQWKTQDANSVKGKIHAGDVVFLPKGMILKPENWIGTALYSYLIFLLVYFIKKKLKKNSG